MNTVWTDPGGLGDSHFLASLLKVDATAALHLDGCYARL